MTTQTAKIRNGTIILPRRLWNVWAEGDVLIKLDKRRIIIERPKPKGRIFSEETERKLQTIGKAISKRDIKDAIKWARKQPQ